MPDRTNRLRCPRCGEAMNHHADKLVQTMEAADTATIDPGLGGVIQETHGCPGCGAVEFRTAPASHSPKLT